MKILVVSSMQDAGRVLNSSPADPCQLYHCAEWTMAQRLLQSRYRSVDWVLVERTALVKEDPRSTKPLRVMDFSSSYGTGTSGQTGGCRVGWNESGVLELHCCQQRRAAAHPGQLPTIPDTTKARPPVYFEYQGPCRKRNR